MSCLVFCVESALFGNERKNEREAWEDGQMRGCCGLEFPPENTTKNRKEYLQSCGRKFRQVVLVKGNSFGGRALIFRLMSLKDSLILFFSHLPLRELADWTAAACFGCRMDCQQCQLPDGLANFAAVTLNPRLEWEEGRRASIFLGLLLSLPLASNCLLHMETSIWSIRKI